MVQRSELVGQFCPHCPPAMRLPTGPCRCPTIQQPKTNLQLMVNKGMDGWLYLNAKYSSENTPNYAKKRQPTQNQNIIKIEI